MGKTVLTLSGRLTVRTRLNCDGDTDKLVELHTDNDAMQLPKDVCLLLDSRSYVLFHVGGVVAPRHTMRDYGEVELTITFVGDE